MPCVTTRFNLELLLSFSLLVFSASAQEAAVSPISTERPTYGYSPDVIPGGSLQVESGSGVNIQKEQFTADLPENFLRIGFFDRFELRYQASNALYSSRLTPGGSQWQTADTQVSGKVLVGRPNQLLPRSAVLSLNLPTGGVSQTSGSYDPGAALIWTQSAPHGWFINEVAVATLTTLHGARRPAWAPSVATGKTLSPRLTLFAEYAPVVTQDGSITSLVDGGFAVLRRATEQIDFRTGYLKDSAGVHTILSVGFSVRHDNLLKVFQAAPITR